MHGRDACKRNCAGSRWIAGLGSIVFVVCGLAGPAFAEDCSMKDLGAKVQELLVQGSALEKRNPAKYKELDPVLTKIMDEDSKPPNNENSAKICADYDKMIEMVKGAK